MISDLLILWDVNVKDGELILTEALRVTAEQLPSLSKSGKFDQ
jgi:hypothetical protein